MKLLVDTHVLVWWLEHPSRLSQRATAILEAWDNTILVSAVVGWEIAIKVGAGKMGPPSIIQGLVTVLEHESFTELPITMGDAVRAGLLPRHHRDPFDRMLISQAQALKVPILSADRVLDQYEAKRLW